MKGGFWPQNKKALLRGLGIAVLVVLVVAATVHMWSRPAQNTDAGWPVASDSIAQSGPVFSRPESGSVDGSADTPSSVSQAESVGTGAVTAGNSRSESTLWQSASASESTDSQSETAGNRIFWQDRACAPVTFAEDPAGCISYAIWSRLEEHLEYINSHEIPYDEKQERIQIQLERPDPMLITSAGLADMNQDGVPELFVFFLGGASNTPIRVYDISDGSPMFIVEYTGGGQVIMDYVYNEIGNEISRVITYFGSVRASTEVVVTFEKQADGHWDIWEGQKEERVGVEEAYIDVFHGREQVDDPDGSLYNQLISRPVAQSQVPYAELDDFPVYEETLSTGEDWWVVYGRMLWEQYQQALQQAETAG